MTYLLQKTLRDQIYKMATPEEAKSLLVDDNYGSPYSFWSHAWNAGLITKDEFLAVQRSYRSDLWHYRGD